MKKTFCLWIVLILVLTAIPVYAQSTLALQEKCAEGAQKFFFEHLQSYGIYQFLPLKGRIFGDEKGFGTINFTPHYNKTHDKCYIRIDYSYFAFAWKTSDENSVDVYNVFENTKVGSISQYLGKKENGAYGGTEHIFCTVGNKRCESWEEFRILIRPYMEE